MTRLREGQPLAVRGEGLAFSFWPLKRGQRRWGLNSMLYTANPWAVIGSSLERCLKAEFASAKSFVRQANEYFRAGAQSSEESSPLLYYYSFMNLAKALALANHQSGLLGRVRHGLRADFGPSLQASTVGAYPSTPGETSVFDELNQSLAGQGLANAVVLDVFSLMAQSLFGHRLWVQGANWRRERFISVDKIELLNDPASKSLWANFAIDNEAWRRRNWGIGEVLSSGDLQPDWQSIRGTKTYDGAEMRVFQQATPVPYTDRPTDVLMEVIASARRRLWRSIFSSDPYRRYYLYMSPPGEMRLHQFLGVYALMFFLGSATRYQPEFYLRALEGPFAAFIREFLASQPYQFLFGIASEFAQREVSRAAVV